MAVKLIKVGNGFNTPVKTYVVDDLSEINKPFYGDKAIVVNDGIYIYGEDDWYPFNADMTLGGSGGGGIADLSAIAPTWTEGTEYIEGDIVSLGGKIYTCNTSSPSRTEFKEDEWAVADSLLGAGGRLRSVYTPQGLDEIFEYDSIEDFPETGESGVIYVDTSDNSTYRYSGTTYVKIGGAGGLTEDDIAAIEGKIITDYNELDNRPIVYNKEENIDEIKSTFKQLTDLSASNWNSVENEYWKGEVETHVYISETFRNENYAFTIPCKKDDYIILVMATQGGPSSGNNNQSFTMVSEGWNFFKNIDYNYGSYMYCRTSIYYKKVSSDSETVIAKYGYWASSAKMFAYVFSGVKELELDSSALTYNRNNYYSNPDTENLVIFFGQSASNLSATEKQSNETRLFYDNDIRIYTMISKSDAPTLPNKPQGYTTYIVLKGAKDFTSIKQLSGVYTKVESGEEFDSNKAYFKMAPFIYKDSEIATKSDLAAFGSADLADTELFEILEDSDIIETVQIQIENENYRLADTDSSVLDFA